MWILAEFTGRDLNDFDLLIGGLTSGEKIYKITFGVDGDEFKMKINEGMWTPRMVKVTHRP